MTPTTETHLTLQADLARAVAALGDEGDVANTPNAQRRYWTRRRGLEGTSRRSRRSARRSRT